MLTKLKAIATKLAGLVYPPTRAKLHRLVTWVGLAAGAWASVEIWVGQLGLQSFSQKFAGQLAALTMLAAGWQRTRPKLDGLIDTLPIPADDAKPEEPAK